MLRYSLRRSSSSLTNALQGFQQRPLQALSLREESTQGAQKYLASCLLERLPVVIPEDEDWEKEWDAWQQQLWQGWLKETPPELYRQKYSKESFAGNEDDEEWEPGPRITEADHKNDTRSLERKLDRRLFLMLHRKNGNAGDSIWELPTIPLTESADNIRDEAEKALREHARGDPEWQIFMVGEPPCGHWESKGATTFVNKAQLIRGKAALSAYTSYTDYAWLCREEAIEKATDENLKQLFDSLLPRYT